MRRVTDLLESISDTILLHAVAGPVEKAVLQVILRLKSDLDRKGFKVRDPQAFTDDILYAFDVMPKIDLNRAKDIFNEYVQRVDSSDL